MHAEDRVLIAELDRLLRKERLPLGLAHSHVIPPEPLASYLVAADHRRRAGAPMNLVTIQEISSC